MRRLMPLVVLEPVLKGFMYRNPVSAGDFRTSFDVHSSSGSKHGRGFFQGSKLRARMPLKLVCVCVSVKVVVLLFVRVRRATGQMILPRHWSRAPSVESLVKAKKIPLWPMNMIITMIEAPRCILILQWVAIVHGMLRQEENKKWNELSITPWTLWRLRSK